MGVKRKASSFESDYTSLQQHPSSPPSMTFSSNTSSPDSMVTEPFHSTFDSHVPSLSCAPWHNSRTHKRVRDNRPDQDQIHTDTVRRLFQAQKTQQQTEDAMMMDGDDYYHGSSLPSPPIEEEDMYDSPQTDLQAPEANQRSLHDFFGRRSHPVKHVPHDDLPPTPPCLNDDSMALEPSPFPCANTQSLLRPPTPQELSAGAPAPVHVGMLLRERPSMGFLSSLNTTPPPSRDEKVVEEAQVGYLPCDFRSKVEMEFLFGATASRSGHGEAMVIG